MGFQRIVFNKRKRLKLYCIQSYSTRLLNWESELLVSYVSRDHKGKFKIANTLVPCPYYKLYNVKDFIWNKACSISLFQVLNKEREKIAGVCCLLSDKIYLVIHCEVGHYYLLCPPCAELLLSAQLGWERHSVKLAPPVQSSPADHRNTKIENNNNAIPGNFLATYWSENQNNRRRPEFCTSIKQRLKSCQICDK